MKTRTTLMLVIALLVVAALPASATDDSQQDACDGLLNALDVLENQTKANQRAIENVRALAADAGCASSEQVCKSLSGTFTADETVQNYELLWSCRNVPFSNDEEMKADVELLIAACLNDFSDASMTVWIQLNGDGSGSGTVNFWCVEEILQP